MSLEDSILSARLVDEESDDETQIEVNEESLFLHDQRELLEKISDKDVSKFEIDYLITNLEAGESSRMYWGTLYKECIKVFSLNTLKIFLSTEFDIDKIPEVKQLVRFLKGELRQILIDDPMPTNREDILKFLKKHKSPHMLIYAIDTVDTESLEKFKKYFM